MTSQTDQLTSAFAGRYQIERELSAGGSGAVLSSADCLNDVTHASYDLLPDGTGFLMVKPVGGDDRPILVHNWGRVLRERLAPGTAATPREDGGAQSDACDVALP